MLHPARSRGLVEVEPDVRDRQLGVEVKTKERNSESVDFINDQHE